MHRASRCVMLTGAALLLVWMVAGCGGGAGLRAPGSDTSSAISHEPTGGVSGFFFLPPIAPSAGDSGESFDPSLVSALKVQVFRLDSAGIPTGAAIATFTGTGDTGTETIRVDTDAKQYVVNFHTNEYALVEGAIYRIFVQRVEDSAEYGFADVQIFSTMNQAKSLVSEDTFALKDGRTLPIHFRIKTYSEPTPPTSKIAFATHRHGPGQLYVMNPDGSEQTRLTDSDGSDYCPSWSPDGTQVAFARAGTAQDIYVVNADGTGEMQLTGVESDEGINVNPSWSPDGSRIAFLSDRDVSGAPSPARRREIWVMDADGSNPVRWTYNLFDDNHVTWSPDGTQIAFHSNRSGYYRIWVMPPGPDPSGTNAHAITGSGYDVLPRWSPDGTMIAFRSHRAGHSNDEIYRMQADGSGQTRLSNSSAHADHPTWSPDSSEIAFTRGDDIYVMSAADGEAGGLRQLTHDAAGNRSPGWSPYLTLH